MNTEEIILTAQKTEVLTLIAHLQDRVSDINKQLKNIEETKK